MTASEPDSESMREGRDERLRALVRHSFDAIALIGPEGTVEYVSPAVTRILGYTPEEFLGSDGFGRTEPGDVEWARGLFAGLPAKRGPSAASDARLRHKDGSWRGVEGRVTNLQEDPAVRSVVVNFRD